MKNQIVTFLFLAIISIGCNSKGDIDPIPILELDLLDSIVIQNESGLLTKPHFVEIIQDSILVCASFMSGGIWIYNVKTGKELGVILSGNEMGQKFFPSSISIKKFPVIEILDGLKGSILKAELQLGDNNRYRVLWNGFVQLEIPEGYSSYPVKSFIGNLENNYLVSIGKTTISQTNPNYFKESTYQFGVFDSLGRFSKFLVKYPDVLNNLSAPILPYEHFKSFNGKDYLYVAFPSSRILEIYTMNQEIVDQIEVPESRFTNFKPIYLDRELNNMDNPSERMQSAYFSHLVESEGKTYFQATIRDNTKLDNWLVYSSILIFDGDTNTWSETGSLFENWKLGRLAGVVRDTLYFVEASMNHSDEKYIRRAILRPAED
jgi:hypothetical protein